MSDSAMIISSEIVSAEKFCNFVKDIGGYVPHLGASRGGIDKGESSVWLGLLDEDMIHEMYSDGDIAEWEAKLGAAPQIIVELRLDHSPRAKLLYLWVVFVFGKKWNSILYDVNDELLSYAQVSDRYQEFGVEW